jgi:hypothetical protein
VDIIATVLQENAVAGDLIVVQTVWEGITFNRYYHGSAQWMTVPPIDSHLVHRNDLVFEKMNQPEAMAPMLREITNTLHSGHSVWLLGSLLGKRPDPPPDQPVKRFEPYVAYWRAQITAVLSEHALQAQVLEIPTGETVCFVENLPLIQFAGYKSGTNQPTSATH